MKAFLMYKDHDFDIQRELPPNKQELIQDLDLDTLFNAMSRGDKFLFEVAKKVILTGPKDDLDTILYRQDILKDCLKNPSVIRNIYDISVESIESKKKSWGYFSKYPSSILRGSMEVLHIFVDMLKKIRNIAHEYAHTFESEGFTRLFSMLRQELSDEYFYKVQNHLDDLKFQDGILISAELGKGNKGKNYILRRLQNKKKSWIKWLFSAKSNGYTFYISDRDENGARALSELSDNGINLVANALAQSADHILSFFIMLRTELAFYIGCLNLYESLSQKGEPISFPLPLATGKNRLSFIGLFDVCLSLKLEERVVGNDVNANNKEFMIITGANQGGKTTFLRSIGLSQLMMQCGMFVAAESFSSNICNGIFTHYKREEDVTMKSGKLDEELSRMSDIIDNITSNSMLLFNTTWKVIYENSILICVYTFVGAHSCALLQA